MAVVVDLVSVAARQLRGKFMLSRDRNVFNF